MLQLSLLHYLVQKKNTDLPKEIVAEVKNDAAVKTANAPVKVAPVVTGVTKEATPATNNTTLTSTAVNFNGGAFKKLYEDQQVNKTSVNETGISGVFKSTSGWRDGKYYCFHNNALIGTIAKITNTVNGKSIYAKVLDLIPDITQNAGLILHISNAAAAELGVSNTRFDCSIEYAK